MYTTRYCCRKQKEILAFLRATCPTVPRSFMIDCFTRVARLCTVNRAVCAAAFGGEGDDGRGGGGAVEAVEAVAADQRRGKLIFNTPPCAPASLLRRRRISSSNFHYYNKKNRGGRRKAKRKVSKLENNISTVRARACAISRNDHRIASEGAAPATRIPYAHLPREFPDTRFAFIGGQLKKKTERDRATRWKRRGPL